MWKSTIIDWNVRKVSEEKKKKKKERHTEKHKLIDDKHFALSSMTKYEQNNVSQKKKV